MIRTRTPIALAIGFLLSPALFAQTLLSENFDNVAGLAGSGWVFQNNSNPMGFASWGQGVVIANYSAAHSGDSTSYAEATVDAVEDQGTISDWMITPALTLENGDSIVFWTVSLASNSYPDRLQVRISPNGGSNPQLSEFAVGDFTDLVLEINPPLDTVSYPSLNAGQTWTRYGAAVTGLAVPTICRVAFRYWVTDGGFLGNNSSAIGIDDLEVSHNINVGINEPTIPVLHAQQGSSNDMVHVTIEGLHAPATMVLMNATGQVLTTMTYNGPSTIDLSGYADGLYVLAVVAGTGSMLRERFVKR